MQSSSIIRLLHSRLGKAASAGKNCTIWNIIQPEPRRICKLAKAAAYAAAETKARMENLRKTAETRAHTITLKNTLKQPGVRFRLGGSCLPTLASPSCIRSSGHATHVSLLQHLAWQHHCIGEVGPREEKRGERGPCVVCTAQLL